MKSEITFCHIKRRESGSNDRRRNTGNKCSDDYDTGRSESVLMFHIGSTEKSVNPVVANKLLMYEDVYPLMRYPKMKHAAVKTNDSARLLMMRVLLEAPISLLVAFSFARVVDKATLRLI